MPPVAPASSVPRPKLNQLEWPKELQAQNWKETVWRTIKSMRMVVISCCLVLIIMTSMLSKHFVDQAAENSLNAVLEDARVGTTSQVHDSIRSKMNNLECMIVQNQKFSASGLVSSNSMWMRVFFDQLQSAHKFDVGSSFCFTNKLGNLNGYGIYTPKDKPSYMVHWNAYDEVLEEWTVDENNGTHISMNYNITDNSTSSTWYNVVDSAGPPTQLRWTNAFLFNNAYFVTFSVPYYSPAGEFLGVMCGDLELGFLNTMVSKITSRSSSPIYVYIVEQFSGFILASSFADQPFLEWDYSAPEPTATSGIYPEKATSKLLLKADATLRDYMDVPAGTPSSTAYKTVTTNIKTEFAMDDHDYVLTASPFEQHNVVWTVVVLMDNSAIKEQLLEANKTTEGVLVGLVFGGAILLFLIMVLGMRPLKHIKNEGKLLCNFEFQEVYAGGDVKDKAFFTEIRDLQVLFLHLSKSFSQHVIAAGGMRSEKLKASKNSNGQTDNLSLLSDNSV